MTKYHGKGIPLMLMDTAVLFLIITNICDAKIGGLYFLKRNHSGNIYSAEGCLCLGKEGHHDDNL